MNNQLAHLARFALKVIEKIPGAHQWVEKRLEFRTFRSYFLGDDPTYRPDEVQPGHRNTRGLTALGQIAIEHMMSLGMMIDVDHMSEHTLESVIQIAQAVPGGYPLNSGHTSFQALGHPTEYGRSDAQMKTLEPLGGMVGINLIYRKKSGPSPTLDEALANQDTARVTNSKVTQDCGGSVTRFTKDYLYAIEKNGGRVALGSDANGFEEFPGPRFGAWSKLKGNYCPNQSRPLSYIGEENQNNDPLIPQTTGKKRGTSTTKGFHTTACCQTFFKI